MLVQWIIEKKRDGQALDADEIGRLIHGYVTGDVPDYQMAAFAMAVCIRGMNVAETAALTDAMLKSGEILDTSSIAKPKLDKHSTGGVGDKLSLIVAPLVASCGIAVPMISGRGLGITGGTLDKMETIPGYRTDLSLREFLRVVDACGCSIIGQTDSIAPADRKLYALRDVTGTVASIPLIVSSIMSKKLAEGLDGLVLDVKCGSGAFMKTISEARALALALVETAESMGKPAHALITDMNEPLGRACGNALEVAEALEVLKGGGPADVKRLSILLSSRMLLLGGNTDSQETSLDRLESKLRSGEAYDVFLRMVASHGGKAASVESFLGFPVACQTLPVLAAADGFVWSADAGGIGRACLVLGAGRTKVTDPVDGGAGITAIKKVGESVSRGEPLAVLHANERKKLDDAAGILRKSFSVREERPPERALVLEETGR